MVKLGQCSAIARTPVSVTPQQLASLMERMCGPCSATILLIVSLSTVLCASERSTSLHALRTKCDKGLS